MTVKSEIFKEREIHPGAVLIITKDDEKKRYTLWAELHEERDILEFTQYLLDSVYLDRFGDFLITDQKKVIPLSLVVERYGMRKRTFDERMKDVKTYKTA